ncbi:hypothetical protein AX15_003369 [Amanita polypyramis BW_CC]|nr:hypothetical protein AX15_003369 [Amanita polypyramis BW_CC]
MSAPPQDNPDKRPLPSGWVSQYNPDYRTWYYINTTAHPPLSTWVHPLDSPSQAPPTSQYAAPPGSPPPPNYSSRPAPTQSYNQGQGYGYDGGPSGYNNQPAGYGGPPGGGPGGYNRPAVGYGQPQGEYRGGNYGQAQYDKYYQEGGYQRPPSPERGIWSCRPIESIHHHYFQEDRMAECSQNPVEALPIIAPPPMWYINNNPPKSKA